MLTKNVTLRIGAAQRADTRRQAGGVLLVRSTKEVVQGGSYLKVTLNLETQEAQHFTSDDQARKAVVKHKRVYFDKRVYFG